MPFRFGISLLLFAWCCALAQSPLAAVAGEAEKPFQPRTSDQIWLVSTRGVDCADQPGWSASQYDAGFWKTNHNSAFYDSDDAETLTVVYVHGNRMDAAGAESRGLAVYREMFGSEAGGKVRFVIWSWPSDQIHGPIKDVRSKAARSDDEAYLLARFLAPIPTNRQVGLVGFSYGARITSGSLHILGGGEVNGRGIEGGKWASFRVVFWAAGVQNDWLLPGNVQDKALPLGKKWLNVYNPCDSVIWRFDKLDRCDGSPALGYTGLAGKETLPADLAEKYEDFDASQLVGSDHRSEPYFFNDEIIRRTREAVLK